MIIKKKCKQCGKEFEPSNYKHDTCPTCFGTSQKGDSPMSQKNDHKKHEYQDSSNKQSSNLPHHLKLNHFYTENNALRKEIFIDTAEEIARIFNRDKLTTAAMRRFFESVRAANERFVHDTEKNFNKAMEGIYRLKPLAHKSQERGITKQSFTEFMDWYIDLTAKEPRNLKGFKELFMSIIGYMNK